MQIDVRHDADVSVVTPAGKLVMGDPETLMNTTVARLLDDGRVKLVFDLNGVTVMDSSGVDTLVRSWRLVNERGGAIRLVNVPSRVKRLLTLTGLDELLGTEPGH